MFMLTMISGVSKGNDYIVGVFMDKVWAEQAGSYFLKIDAEDCPEYVAYKITPKEST